MSIQAGTITVTGTANTSGQSIWSQGSAFQLNYFNSVSTGNLGFTTPDLGPGIGCTIGICAGADVFATAHGSLGVDFGFNLNSGSVAASVPVSVGLGVPTSPVKAGTAFSVSAGNFAFGNGTLNTTGTTAQAFSDFNYALSAGIYGQGCYVVGCSSFGSTTDIANSSGRKELFGLNRSNDGQLRVVGQTFGFGQPISIGNYGSATIDFPHGPDTSGGGTTSLSSFGSSTLASIDINAANVATDLLDLPPLSGDFGVSGLVDFNYNLFSADAILSLNLTQQFSFLPTASLFLDVQETGQMVPLSANGMASILFPTGDRQLHITPLIDLSGSLTNNTGLCIDPSLDLSAVGGSLDILGKNEGSIGPLLNYSHDFGCYGGTVYSTTFNLGGFSEITGQTFTVQAATPEPGPWVLVSAGLLIVMGGRRRPASLFRSKSSETLPG